MDIINRQQMQATKSGPIGMSKVDVGSASGERSKVHLYVVLFVNVDRFSAMKQSISV